MKLHVLEVNESTLEGDSYLNLEHVSDWKWVKRQTEDGDLGWFLAVYMTNGHIFRLSENRGISLCNILRDMSS